MPPAFARRCYGHLAGRLGVAVADALIESGVLRPASETTHEVTEYELTDDGEAWFRDLGVAVGALKPSSRGMARPCLDGTERRPHLGGPLAVALLERLMALGWLEPGGAPRALRVTPAGEPALAALLGIEVAALRDERAGL